MQSSCRSAMRSWPHMCDITLCDHSGHYSAFTDCICTLASFSCSALLGKALIRSRTYLMHHNPCCPRMFYLSPGPHKLSMLLSKFDCSLIWTTGLTGWKARSLLQFHEASLLHSQSGPIKQSTRAWELVWQLLTHPKFQTYNTWWPLQVGQICLVQV